MKRLIHILLIVFLLGGCGYGKVSPMAYEYAKSLYSITNRKLTDRLEPVKEQVAAAQQSDAITADEARWLFAIIDKAESGRWESAMKSARRLMEDQVTR